MDRLAEAHEAVARDTSLRISRVKAQRIAALVAADRMPAAAPGSELTLGERREAPIGAFEGYLWLVCGDDMAPRGVMALRPQYDVGYGRWVLELGDIRGDVWAVHSMLRHAQRMAHELGFPLTGEIATSNTKMQRMFATLGAPAADRSRFTWGG